MLVDSICYNSIDPKKAQICFTTAHRAKGMEYDQVKLTHDYAELVIKDKKTGQNRLATLDDVDDQELNLAYIAISRAKKVLQLNKQIKEFLNFIGKI